MRGGPFEGEVVPSERVAVPAPLEEEKEEGAEALAAAVVLSAVGSSPRPMLA